MYKIAFSKRIMVNFQESNNITMYSTKKQVVGISLETHTGNPII